MGWNRNDEDYRADRDRDERKHDFILDEGVRQRLAVAALIGRCEGICEGGRLHPENEKALRELIAEALSAFNMSAANRDERQ